jgi:hypothetical protein
MFVREDREIVLDHKPGLQVKCRLIDVFRGDDAPDDREILAVLDVRCLYRGESGVQEIGELTFRLSFTSEIEGKGEGEQTELKILKVGLFRPAESAMDIHEPLPTTNPAYRTMEIRNISPSEVYIVVNKFPLQRDTSLRVAVLIQRRSGDDALHLVPTFEFEGNSKIGFRRDIL